MTEKKPVSRVVRSAKFWTNEYVFMPTDPEVLEMLNELLNELKPRKGANIKITLEQVKG